MNYIKISPCDIANGDGCRVVLWVAGCEHHCKGCHNPQTWDENAGKEFTEDTMQELLQLLRPSYIAGLTLSGGDPLFPKNVETVVKIVKKVRETYPEKTIWLYTGYDFWKDVLVYSFVRSYIDVVVDGKYIEAKRDTSLKFRGSSNQNIFYIHHTRNSKDQRILSSVIVKDLEDVFTDTCKKIKERKTNIENGYGK